MVPYGDNIHKYKHKQRYHSIVPGIDRYDRIGSNGVGLVECNDIGCIFNGNSDRNRLDNDITLGMFVFIFFFFRFRFYF